MNSYESGYSLARVPLQDIQTFARDYGMKLTIDRGVFGLESPQASCAWSYVEDGMAVIYAESRIQMLDFKKKLRTLINPRLRAL